MNLQIITDIVRAIVYYNNFQVNLCQNQTELINIYKIEVCPNDGQNDHCNG